MKKILIVIFGLLFLGIVLIIFLIPAIDIFNPKGNTSTSCPFCDPKVLEQQQYYEGQLVRVLYNYLPLMEGHSLIIPKRHVSRFEDLTAPEVTEMAITVNKVQKAFEKVYKTSDYLLVMQNGKLAGQTVSHVHFHMIPRKDLDYFTKLRLWLSFLSRGIPFADHLSPEELAKKKAPLQEAMQNLYPPLG